MIGIRSVTFQLPEKYALNDFKELKKGVDFWKHNYSFIRTFRVNICPLRSNLDLKEVNELACISQENNIKWFNIPINPSEVNQDKLFSFALNVLEQFKQAFVNVIAIENDKINFEVLNNASKLIVETSKISINGNDNFRLGTSFNIGKGGAFFPFTMSSGSLGFSIALELTQEINRILKKSNHTIDEVQHIIYDALIPQIQSIDSLVRTLEKNTKLTFMGFDFSLAPIHEEQGSVISILDKLGMSTFGSTGMFFATAYLTNILKNIGKKFKTIGFSGVMYSLLEDACLCNLNNDNKITIEQLISWSTMCGCGLDMVPVNGDISAEKLNSILLDIAGISIRLKKPLGVRILPIPTNGEYTQFENDTDFIANTKVINVNNYAFSFSKGMFNFMHI